MRKRMRFILPLICCSVTALTGCDFITIVDNDDDSDVIEDKGTYYKNYNMELEGGRLHYELQKQCFDKHKTYITYSQVNSYYVTNSSHDSAEAVKAKSKLNQWFYTGKEATGYGTREHVWPCASSARLWVHDKTNVHTHNVDNGSYVGGGSDLYHVRTCNSTVNTARGDSHFVEFSDPEMESYRDSTMQIGESGGKYKLTIQGKDIDPTSSEAPEYADRAEPVKEMKGDVARIILYLWIHYTDRGIAPSGSIMSGGLEFTYQGMTGSLLLTDIMGYKTEERCLEKLKEWNKIDPPSTVEIHRNDTVQRIQGNRNPFVDFPNLADQL